MAKDNRPAAQSTGTEFFPADTAQPLEKYIQPRVNPNSSDIGYQTDPNTMSAMESAPGMPARRVGGGNPASKQMNKHGETQIRGCGAATKGTKARGPMA
jgi:hypothetical protein